MTWPTLCPFALLLGYPCPGCGMGRSLWACLNGEVTTAFTYHPLGPPLLAAALVAGSSRLMAKKSVFARNVQQFIERRTQSNGIWIVLLAVTLGIWIARFGGALGGPVEVYSPVREMLRPQSAPRQSAPSGGAADNGDTAERRPAQTLKRK
jgi:hypothetical protein